MSRRQHFIVDNRRQPAFYFLQIYVASLWTQRGWSSASAGRERTASRGRGYVSWTGFPVTRRGQWASETGESESWLWASQIHPAAVLCMTSDLSCAGKETISVEDPWLTPDGWSAPSNVSPPGKCSLFKGFWSCWQGVGHLNSQTCCFKQPKSTIHVQWDAKLRAIQQWYVVKCK